MGTSVRPIAEADLLAYIDGQLGPERRAEVEEHLLRHAEDRLRIAADSAIAEGLRLLFGQRRQAAPRRLARRRAYSFLA